MQLKQYQTEALAAIKQYLELLSQWRAKAVANPDLEIDFPAKAWDKAGIVRRYVSRKNGLDQALPTFCLKVPTGGGKTLLAVKTIDLVNTYYRQYPKGLVLWIVPTAQIYKQTFEQLKDRNHPYRQNLDLASGGHTIILEKTDHFSPQDLAENLAVLMLMLPSANRKTKETLRVFKDNGGFQDFFPPDDDIKAHEEKLKQFPNLDTYEKQSGFWGRQIKTSLGNTLRTLAPLIILDEGHKAYSKGAQETLRSFNPCLIAELSATPTESNVLVDIPGRALLEEGMIKLDLHVVNKTSLDWKDTLLAGFEKRSTLEDRAREYEANTGVYIRPICLIQVERTGKKQIGGRLIHSEEVREHLVKVMGVPTEQVVVKTSEKDELKSFDDIGGLLARECSARFIITKQALQEGWDCSFAYVLVILTNPSSKNALTQLVGRILRQPYARKTHCADLDESYVFCFRQRANVLLEHLRAGFMQEGLGDLQERITTADEGRGDAEQELLIPIRKKFKEAASRTILPVFVVRNGAGWRAVNYEMDIAAKIPWDQVDLNPVLQLTFSNERQTDVEINVMLDEDRHEVIRQRSLRDLHQGGIRVDTVFMTRQLCDIVPNPWRAYEFGASVVAHFRKKGVDERELANNFVFLIEETRKKLSAEKERLAEAVFREMLQKDQLRFLIIAKELHWTFPHDICLNKNSRILTKDKGEQLELNLFEKVPEDAFNETEKAVAWYLENQSCLFFWYRNRARCDYSIQGWRQHRIYPDFIFTASHEEKGRDCQRVYVIETKGLHLKDNDKTTYIRRIFQICTEEATSRSWSELGLEMKDKNMRFEVLAEDQWKKELNKMLQ